MGQYDVSLLTGKNRVTEYLRQDRTKQRKAGEEPCREECLDRHLGPWQHGRIECRCSKSKPQKKVSVDLGGGRRRKLFTPAQVNNPQTAVMSANHPKTSPAFPEPADMKERKEKAIPAQTATQGRPYLLTLVNILGACPLTARP